MKRNITISSISKTFSTSMVEQGLGMGVAFLSRCRYLTLGNWTRLDLALEHPEPLDYKPTERSGWLQPLSCYAPN